MRRSEWWCRFLYLFGWEPSSTVYYKKEGERNDQERKLAPLCSEKTICGNLQPRATTSLFVGGLCWESSANSGKCQLDWLSWYNANFILYCIQDIHIFTDYCILWMIVWYNHCCIIHSEFTPHIPDAQTGDVAQCCKTPWPPWQRRSWRQQQR